MAKPRGGTWSCRRINRTALIHLDVGISLLEVDQVVFARQPAGHLVLDLVDLGIVTFRLDEAAEGFRIAHEAMFGVGRDEHACTQVLLVVSPGGGCHLPGALQVDILSGSLGGIGCVVSGTHDEARQTYEVCHGEDFTLEG
jgi:hypothetical protein